MEIYDRLTPIDEEEERKDAIGVYIYDNIMVIFRAKLGDKH